MRPSHQARIGTRLFQPAGECWRSCSRFRFSVLGLWLCFFCGMMNAAEPISFEFRIVPDGQNPFAREIWAEVLVPTGSTLSLPAFYCGKDRYAVRARAAVIGEYGLGKITETKGNQTITLPATLVGRGRVVVRELETRPPIGVSRTEPQQFVFPSGEKFVPVGANLAWPDKRNGRFYDKTFDAFAREGLNWSRVWMAHWSGLNLDWLPDDIGRSPRPGTLDLHVADRWDKIISEAEASGVYLQVVLQHHGQYSSKVNSNWNQNPWNVAKPGGFLVSPSEFFTSPEAQRFTMQKIRYMIARWGYSPTVMAWELFNEVHWSDALRENHNESGVAQWHAKMAAYIRSLDRYGHLITTSTESLHSAIYADMDYLQPHLYVPNPLAGVRLLDSEPAVVSRPVFYGEFGDDHQLLSAEEKKSGIAIVPPAWASLMGPGRYPAQPWLGQDLMATGRLHELGAVARFVAATRLGRRLDLKPFCPATECATRIPFVLAGGQRWKPSPDPEITVPLDGREPAEFAVVPMIFVSPDESKGNGFPSRATYHFDFPKPATLRLHIVDTGAASSSIRATVDGAVAAEASWAERPRNDTDNTSHPQPDILVPVSVGPHTVVVANTGSEGWFDLAKIDLGLEIPILAAVGQRSDRFLAVWLWHRTGVFSSKSTASAEGTLVLDDVSAGTWRVTWWDSLNGMPLAPVVINHPGGALRLSTPAISRHAAVVIERQDP